MLIRPSRTVVLGLLAGLAAVLQLGPVYWPGPGYLLAMAATLPAAVGTALHAPRAHQLYAAAAVLIGLVAVEEMFVFLLTTGPLGLMLGYLHERPAWQALPVAAGVLTAGMLALPYLAGIDAFGGLGSALSRSVLAAGYFGFSMLYAALWRTLFTRVWTRIGPLVQYSRQQEVQRSWQT